MIYNVKRTASYKKGYNRMKKRGANISELNYVVNELRCGRKLDKKYKDHALIGNRAGSRECHIRSDWLLVYEIKDNILQLLLLDTAMHDEVLGV